MKRVPSGSAARLRVALATGISILVRCQQTFLLHGCRRLKPDLSQSHLFLSNVGKSERLLLVLIQWLRHASTHVHACFIFPSACLLLLVQSPGGRVIGSAEAKGGRCRTRLSALLHINIAFTHLHLLHTCSTFIIGYYAPQSPPRALLLPTPSAASLHRPKSILEGAPARRRGDARGPAPFWPGGTGGAAPCRLAPESTSVACGMQGGPGGREGVGSEQADGRGG